ncbi:Phage integrase family protein [Arenibacter nanhaiticus]|uniref:Phage integrase family protein n=1 Tax=Arenibacter nanhaiticus TaxID=558155 RepID=A0A1M6NFG0_9FLAO|nr:tyrosine-type recombinase/integrase [Arenibacter nanhaiticus]SHJ94427.1 Phage integrase family protein [Arenibacter nanhaiticus]
MNNTVVYTSVLAPYFTSYLNEKFRLGHKAQDIKYTLLTIDQFLNQIKHGDIYISKDVYEYWLNTIQEQKTSTIYSKASIFIRFLKYMSEMGMECYIPRLPRKHDSGFVPYIYSQEEIKKIFVACDGLRARERHAKSILIIIPALIRVLYSTAIRISEALAIKNKNVDLVNNIIILNHTKNGSQRLAPINSSLKDVLVQYIEYRNRIPVSGITDSEGHFFVSSLGKPCIRRTVSKLYHKVLSEAGIPYKGNQEGPTIHGIRHTACVHSLVKMAKDGKDIYCCLPLLSTFIGHKKVLDTEHYLRLTCEIYPELIELDASVTAGINGVIERSLLINSHESL